MIKLYTSFLNIEEFEEIFNRYCQDFPSMKKWFFNSNIELLTGCPISVNKVLTCWKQKRIINHYVQNVTKKIAEYNQMTFLAFFFFFFFILILKKLGKITIIKKQYLLSLFILIKRKQFLSKSCAHYKYFLWFLLKCSVFFRTNSI